MLPHRSLIEKVGLVVSGLSVSGCLSQNEEDSTSTRKDTLTATETESTPHPLYAECPDDPTAEVRGEGEPLRMSRTRGPPATYDGDTLEGFVAETCASLYAEDVADEIEDRTGHEFRQTVRDEGSRTGPVEPYIAANLLFDFQTASGELREAPPIGFDRYREAAPASLTASVIVNDETHECTVPVRVGCSRLVLD